MDAIPERKLRMRHREMLDRVSILLGHVPSAKCLPKTKFKVINALDKLCIVIPYTPRTEEEGLLNGIAQLEAAIETTPPDSAIAKALDNLKEMTSKVSFHLN